MKALRSAGFVALALTALLYCVFNLNVGTNLGNFMPTGTHSELAALLSKLSDSPLTRTMLFSVAGEGKGEAADELAAVLRAHPNIEWVRSAVDDTELEDLYSLYFPRRFYFLSDEPEAKVGGVDALFDEAELRREARAARTRLASPAGSLLARTLPADPVSSFARVIERFRNDQPTLTSEGGRLVTADGTHAILIASTAAPAFESGPQSQLLDDIEAAWHEIRSRQGAAASLQLEMSGGNRFAVHAERSMKADIYKIAAFTFVGVTALFLTIVGSLRGFLVVSLAPLTGVLAATTLGLLYFGKLDGLTMAFGASLMGIAIDYSNHLLIHHGLASDGRAASESARRLRPSLLLGAATTIASFTGLAATAFPAFREMAFFAIVGVSAGVLTTLYVMPGLLGWVPALPGRAAKSAAGLQSLLDSLAALPKALWLLPAVVIVASAWFLPQLQWSDDMSKLTNFSSELMEEDRRVRARVSGTQDGRFVIALVDDDAEVLAVNDTVHARLQQAVGAGALESTRSLHGLIWSEALQRRNWEALQARPSLAAKVEAAFASEGFNTAAFAPFRTALEEAPPPPLRLEDLRSGALGNLLAPYLFPVGPEAADGSRELAVITYLNGIHDEAVVRAAVADLPRVHFVDQRSFVNDVYGEFRRTTLEQMVVGAFVVLVLLLLRYRRWRPVVAAALPAALVALGVLALLAARGTPVNLLHVMSLLMVTGMGVDYGIFLVDSARHGHEAGATMLSLLMSCLTTALVFGALAFSSQPALQAIGVTTGVGVLLSYALAPVALLAVGLAGEARE